MRACVGSIVRSLVLNRYIGNVVISLEILIVLNRYIGDVVIPLEILIVLNSQTSRKSKILIFR